MVIVVHGGSWRARYGKSVTKLISVDLTRRGLAAWNIEYRRMGRGQGGGWPATFDDVAAAIDLLPAVAGGRLDLGSVAIAGHSAGGQLALWAASRRDSRVAIGRVAALAAPCNMAAAEPAHELLGGTPEQVPQRFDQADPMRLVPIGVPILLVHGVEDRTVPVARSRDFAEAARAAGDEVELIEPAPGGHRIHIDPRSRSWQLTADWLVHGPRLPRRPNPPVCRP